MSILDNAKEVVNAVHEMKNLDLYERVLNLNGGIIELVEENRRLREENRDLQDKIRLKGEMKFAEPFYFRDGDRTPHCPGCWESKLQPVHVVFQWEDGPVTMWTCPACKHDYRIDKSRGRQQASGFYFNGSGGPDEWMGR